MDKDIRVISDGHIVADRNVPGPDDMHPREDIDISAVVAEDHPILCVLEMPPKTPSHS